MATRATLEPRLAACTTAQDLYTLAREAFDEPADAGFAQTVFAQPAFAADPAAKAVLDEVAGGAMFTGDFVACAIGYKALGEDAKAADALQQGADFAMNADEKVAVGLGTLIVTGDVVQSGKLLAGALKEISTTEPLYALFGVVATQVKDIALASQIVDKIKTKCGRAADFARLARSVASDLMDKVQGAAIINEGAAKYGSPADLITLSGVMGEIDPAAAGGLYAQALDSAKDFTGLMQVLKSAEGNAEFTRAVLAKGGSLATATGEFLQLADACVASGDVGAASAMVAKAEESVANLDEMRKVVEGIEKHAANDVDWLARSKDKLARREANQAKYVEFQSAEGLCKTVREQIALADRIMLELGDAAYAGKVLANAETALREDGFHFSRFKPLILAVDRTGDKAWLSKLLDESIASAADFVWFSEIVRTVGRELKDTQFGRERAEAAVQARAASAGENPYDWTRLAELARDALANATEATRILGEAAARASDHFALAQVAKLYHDMGAIDAANAAFARAADACQSAEASLQLATRLKSYGMENSRIAELMDGVGGRLNSASDRLRWAAGVADLLMDKDWIKKTYDGIADQFKSETEKRALSQSAQMRLGYRFYGPGVQPH